MAGRASSPELRDSLENLKRFGQRFAAFSVYPHGMTFHTMSRAASFAALLALAAASPAQGPVLHAPPANTTKPPAANASTPAADAPAADALVISFPAVVRDKHGDLLQNLTKDSFVLQVDDRPQTLHSVSADKDLPLTLGILVDTSMSHRDVLDEERTATSAFLDSMVTGEPDTAKAFIVQFARQIDLLQDVTTSKSMLHDAIKQLRSSGNPNQASVTDPRDTASADSRNLTIPMYDSLFLSADEIMSKQKGRKALIILSDGIDKGSKKSLEDAAEAAVRADTVIYAIYFKGKEPNLDRGFHVGQPDPTDCSNYPGGYPGGYPPGGYPGGYPPGGYPGGYPGDCPPGGRVPQGIPLPEAKKTMQHLTAETGGRTFDVGGKDTIAEIYKQIAEELRAQYRLSYAADKDTASEGFHRINLSLANSAPKEFSIETYKGYYIGD